MKELFERVFGKPAEDCEAIAAGGSHRLYFRLKSGKTTAIGVEGTDRDENRAFLYLADHFRKAGLPVPEIFAVSGNGLTYLQEDLGSVSLFDLLWTSKAGELLEKTIRLLPKIQFEGARGLDFSVCYPQKEFDGRMVDFDLNYFKYCFLKLSPVEFNEVLLQNDFDAFKEALLGLSSGDTFMYRDFQARNIMIKGGEPWLIDFQGGRRGPVYYDLASFVWQARAGYPEDLREKLINDYYEELCKYRNESPEDFRSAFGLFSLFRVLQVLGAYGYRGLYERKKHFLESIVPALANLRGILSAYGFEERFPYMTRILLELAASPLGMPEEEPLPEESSLVLEVMSFSFRKGLPEDNSGNGGGYIFDCRGMHNPGRYEEYKSLTGRDREVIEFLEDRGEVQKFLGSVESLLSPHIKRYIKRGFSHLQVSFGCTGGQHRSVYCAEHVADWARREFPMVSVVLRHREQEI
ncbi:MAG: phosphotransferase [Bacteroidales bacterium]|nr:phosphotransferase [Bacteroidales bacterium]